MGKRVLEDVQAGFGGGLNTIAAKTRLQENEFLEGENASLTEEGAVRICRGSQRIHASAINGANPVYGTSWRQASSTVEYVLCNGTLYKATYAIPVSSWTSVGTGLSTSHIPRFAHFRDGTGERLYFALNGLKKTDGSTVSTPASVPSGISQVVVYNQRLYGVTGQDDFIYASSLNNGDTLGVAASGGIVAKVRTFGGQYTSGLAVLGGSLLIFHRGAISRFRGLTQDDVSIETGTEGVSAVEGTIAPGSIVVVEQEGGGDIALFLTSRGLYAATEAGVSSVSNNIENVLANLDQSQWGQVCAVHVRRTREVWFYIPGVGAYIWNYHLKAWSGPRTGTMTTSQVRSLWETLDGNSNAIVLGGDSAGFVKRFDMPDVYLDDVASDGSGGTNYTFAVKCRRMYCGDPFREKAFHALHVIGDTGGSTSMQYQAFYARRTGIKTLDPDGDGDGGAVWGGFNWDDGTLYATGVLESRHYSRPLGGSGDAVELLFTDSSGRDVQIERVGVEAYDMGRR